MSRTISIPVRLSEVVKGDSRPICPLKSPILYPDQCAYCAAPKSESIAFDVSTESKREGEAEEATYHYTVTMPYCEKHAGALKRLTVLFATVFGVGALAMMILFIVAGQNSSVYRVISQFLAALGWMGKLLALSIPVGAGLLGGLLVVSIFKVILGQFVPTIKALDVSRIQQGAASLGVEVKISKPKRETGSQIYTMDFTFANEEFAVAFESLNKWEGMQSLDESSRTFVVSAEEYKMEAFRLFEKGLHKEAAAMFEQAREIFETEGNEIEEAEMRNNLGIIYQAQGEWDNAIVAIDRARKTFSRLGDRDRESQTLRALSELYNSRGETQKAEALLQQASDLSAD